MKILIQTNPWAGGEPEEQCNNTITKHHCLRWPDQSMTQISSLCVKVCIYIQTHIHAIPWGSNNTLQISAHFVKAIIWFQFWDRQETALLRAAEKISERARNGEAWKISGEGSARSRISHDSFEFRATIIAINPKPTWENSWHGEEKLWRSQGQSDWPMWNLIKCHHPWGWKTSHFVANTPYITTTLTLLSSPLRVASNRTDSHLASFISSEVRPSVNRIYSSADLWSW